MTSPDLPAELKAALDGKLRGFSRNDAAGRAASISKTYRDGGGSGGIRSETDALAYALARMPATYAAVAASLNALVEIRPDFAPNSLLDIGAGPGTATWAAAVAFPSLKDFALLDANTTLRALALDLARDSTRLRDIRYERGEARAALVKADAADLVMAAGRVLRISALPSFLKTYIDRVSFSFTDYLRNERDSSTELHQWIRRNYTSFRELELSLLPQQS